MFNLHTVDTNFSYCSPNNTTDMEALKSDAYVLRNYLSNLIEDFFFFRLELQERLKVYHIDVMTGKLK